MNLTSTTENNFQFQTIIDQSSNEMVSIRDFVDSQVENYDVEKLYVDVFWNSLNTKSNDEWIEITDDMISSFGYKGKDENTKHVRASLFRFIERNNNFTLNQDYFFRSHECDPKDETINGKKENRGGHNKKTLYMKKKALKKLMLSVNTQKSSQLHEYYITLEDIFRDYVLYQNEFKIFQQKKTIDELQQNQFKLKPCSDIYVKKYEPREKIYIMTRKTYAKRNLYKVGRSTNALKRLVSLNTGNIFEQDKLYICFIQPTYDAKNCENRIHKLLDQFKYNKEFYRLPFQFVKDIVVGIGESYIYHNAKINEAIIKLNDFLTGSVDLIRRCKEEDIPRPLSRHEIQSIEADIEDDELSCSDLDEEEKIEPNEEEIVIGEEKNDEETNDEEKDNGELNILKRIINEHYTSKNRIPIWVDICDLLKENLNTRKIDLKLWKNNVMRLENQKIRWRKNGKVETINPGNTNNIRDVSTNRTDNNSNIENVGTLTIYNYFNKRK
ncbi:hypothetical protein [Heterosigma akashiwo virus 01]|uniref:Bacteriophage T5 Orf172 DNA-binding domain-containing protein n=1 Tax=Heterosigma akashiwo virus 01 TaxID=97195 RepID=A0A1C9C5C5_HAV01|nr:hypothetical protein D1R72_gp155 [Heterosigma akashiwo virus 01]AOM63486.1 hypothetical protein [Heterosigma akashiwo virus 01]